ncbi:hypothetical protein B0T18DRAFT_486976 [Schizothecium vesticola]|uniref:Uncharacterized protein n=1 Tax=Schizothecium vesticola TaxID=314040 RepID=A0AA40K849_9PEZI|nr:hypothetical protein B0T18DRAFT_486976 [Schizothecium vesticola]
MTRRRVRGRGMIRGLQIHTLKFHHQVQLRAKCFIMASLAFPKLAKKATLSDGTTYGCIYVPAAPSKPTFLLLHGAPSSTYVHNKHLFSCLIYIAVGFVFVDTKLDPAVELQQCTMGGEEILSLFRLCPNLQSQTYSCGGACHGDEQFSPDEAAGAVLTEALNLR